MRRPPANGPTAVLSPTVAPNSPNALPRSAPLNSSWMDALICGVSAPPASPWTRRAMMSHTLLCAAPQAALASVNAASATTNMVRRPRRSPSRPAGTSSSPKVSAYPDTTHCKSLCWALRPASIEGSATFTMETSSRTMKPPTRQTASACHRRGSGASAMGGEYAVGTDRQIAVPDAGCVPHRIRNRGCRTDNAELADALHAEGIEVLVMFVDPADLQV